MNPEQFINGKWCVGQAEPFVSLNPYSGEIIWQGHSASGSDVDKAVRSAATAFFKWRNVPMVERQAFIARFIDLLSENAEALARTIAIETAKKFRPLVNFCRGQLHRICARPHKTWYANLELFYHSS